MKSNTLVMGLIFTIIFLFLALSNFPNFPMGSKQDLYYYVSTLWTSLVILFPFAFISGTDTTSYKDNYGTIILFVFGVLNSLFSAALFYFCHSEAGFSFRTFQNFQLLSFILIAVVYLIRKFYSK